MRKGIWTAGLAASALAATLALNGEGPGSLSPPPAAAETGLVAFDDCAELVRWYRASALEQVTAYGLGDDVYGGPIPVDGGMVVDGVLEVADSATSMSAARSAAVDGEVLTGPPVGNAETGTNVQEAGVDEPDVAKTDGSMAYVLDGRDLVVTDVTGKEPVEAGRLTLPRSLRDAELLLVGDRLMLFSAGATAYREPFLLRSPHVARSVTTVMTVIDVADPATMRVLTKRRLDGELLAARAHDGTVRVVIRSTPKLTFVRPGLRWDLPTAERRDSAKLTAAEALAANRRIIRRADVQAFLPQQRVRHAARQPLLDCADVAHPSRNAGLGTISVLTFDPAQQTAPQATAVATDGDQVYSSADRMYVATTAGGWWSLDRGVSPNAVTTDVHAFDVTGTQSSYVASGDVPGYVKDRWSFSEHEGMLRIATTDGDTRVSVLEENGARLEVVGSIGGMGVGETLESVRWFDDLAIVVTFRQVDPLYTVDLSDPRSPAVMGELKIPGFSSYLHPLGDDLLLGIGQDARADGWTVGTQASSFDVSDLRQPTRVAALSFGPHRYSAVEDDPRAFTYLPAERLALLPVDAARAGTRLAAVRVGPHGTLTHAGSMSVSRTATLRALPLPDGRVAVVAAGSVVELVDPQRLGQTMPR